MERALTDNLVDTPQVPISDFETEKALIALCLKNKEALDTVNNKGVTKTAFADNRNMLIFEAISRLYLQSGVIDRFNICDELEKKGTLSKAGGTEYVFQVADTPSISSNVDSYIKIIKEKESLRQLVNVLKDMDKKARSGQASTNSVIDFGIDRLTGMREDPEGVGFEMLNSILRRNLKDLHKSLTEPDKNNIIRSGFRRLDKMLGGYRPGTLNILAARPGMGKTALVINIATNVASMSDKPVNIFSLEMSKEEIGNRILASRSSVSASDLSRANVSRDKEEELSRAFKELSNLRIFIDDNSAVTPALMMSRCKELQAQNKLGLVIVDYLQLMSSSDSRKGASRQEEITAISRSLKILAKDLHVPVIALSQLSRGAGQREDHTPQLTDLRDSGAIEQDADSVLFIDRDDYYKQKDENLPAIQDAKLIVAKNRHGETGTVKVKWYGAKTLFFEENANYDPVDPTSTGAASAYTRTTTPGASASDYHFEEPPVTAPAEPVAPVDYDPGVPPPEEPPFDTSDEVINNPDNDDFFDNSVTDFPEGFV